MAGVVTGPSIFAPLRRDVGAFAERASKAASNSGANEPRFAEFAVGGVEANLRGAKERFAVVLQFADRLPDVVKGAMTAGL